MASGVTSMQINQILNIQEAFQTLAMLNMVGYLFPEDAPICDGDKYDYIVVGGGTAGCVVAGRLVEANFKTLVIEAGDNPGEENYAPGLLTYTKNSRMDWTFTTPSDGFTDQCHKNSGAFFGKVLGGSGNVDYLLYGRGNPQDYRKFNEDSWNWKNMLKYFLKSEKLNDNEILKSRYRKYHGTKGKIGVIKENRMETQEYLQAYKEAGKKVISDVIGAGMIGYSGALYHISKGLRTESATGYLSPLKDDTNLHLTRNSTAVKIIFDKNKRAVGVEFVKNGKSITVRANKEVIVTTGAIKTPQLLMLSGIGPKEKLEKLNITVLSNIPVGKKLQDNVGVLLGFKTNKPAKNAPYNYNDYPAQLIIGYSALRNCSCDPDYQTINYIIDDSTYLLKLCGFSLGFKNSICDRIYSNNTQIFLSIILPSNVGSFGEVVLKNTDPFAMPNIFPNYYTNNGDLNDIVDYIMDYYKVLETPKFQSMGLKFVEETGKCGRFQFGSRQFWRCYALCMIVPPGRYVGTCSMGSVVDSRLNVMGVKKLRVVDASVIPGTIGSALFGPTVALAEKGAEMILEDSS
ncbi:hypothetical protein HF086_005925 [Spodoptera exigua]|uniref:Glucose-methanol-choline oxidoreductase N-terminal domain-containing protein n=1 Tax=Spodoptera exigua TaxID=7107 RepID=A0A922S8I8_SPOEX|nr:hypothetical protein HF086_005925 [Spodoptera exigua]